MKTATKTARPLGWVELRVEGLECKGLGFRVKGLGFRGFRFHGSGFHLGVLGSGFRLRVWG